MSEALTDRELDVWIAENLFGWERIKDWGVHDDLTGRLGSIWKYDKSPYANQLAIPHFSTDLNLCAQAEAKINENWEWNQAYTHELMRVVKTHALHGYPRPDRPTPFSWAGLQALRSANARQRCEAIYAIREHSERVPAKDKSAPEQEE